MRGGTGVVAAPACEDGGEALVERLDGDVDGGAEPATKRSVSLGLLATLAAQRQRQPDDDPFGRLLARRVAQAGEPGVVAARSTVQSGRATVPVGSETATPVRAEP